MLLICQLQQTILGPTVFGTRPIVLCIFWLRRQLLDLVPLPPQEVPPLLLLPHHQRVDHPPVDLIQALALGPRQVLGPLLQALRQVLDPPLLLPLVLLVLGTHAIMRRGWRGRL